MSFASFDLAPVEAFIERLDAPPQAQHLMNEVLWRYDASPEFFMALGDMPKFAAIAETQPTVRLEASGSAVANDLWAALSRKGLVGSLNDAALAYRRGYQ